MGNAAGVGVPPEAVAAARHATSSALVQAKHAAILAHLHATQVIHIARRYYAVADERVISRVQRVVEREVLRRVHRLMDEIDVKSKILFVKHISNTTIAQAYHVDIKDVKLIQISKRHFEVYNCGPELLHVPTLNKVSRSLELRDEKIIDFMLSKCMWTPWYPPVSWRMKTDQTYDMTVHVAVRHEGFLTGEVRVIKLRIGKKWVGPHHHDTMEHASRSMWLHRTDYEVTGRELIVESEFFQTVRNAWQDFLNELARQPKEDLASGDENGQAFPYEDQDRLTSLRVKYLVETSIDQVMKDYRPMFRSVHQYELWRMEQEDKPEHQMSNENSFAGPLVDGEIDALAEYYEAQAMSSEDVKIWM